MILLTVYCRQSNVRSSIQKKKYSSIIFICLDYELFDEKGNEQLCNLENDLPEINLTRLLNKKITE